MYRPCTWGLGFRGLGLRVLGLHGSYPWLAGSEGMEKKIEKIMMG